MELLDAVLAFALTMGALAAVATIFLEGAHRAFKTRKRNLIDVIRCLNRELEWLSEEERWTFATRVLNNPSQPGKGLPEEIPVAGYQSFLNKLGRWNRRRSKDRPEEMLIADCQSSLDRLSWRSRRRGIYDTISLEHVLRRFAELPSVQLIAQTQHDRVKAELDRIARRYQEIRSAVSADFTRRSQMWSLVVGIAFAAVANVDAIRIFDAYRNDRVLATRIIAKQGDLEQSAQMVERNRKAVEEATRQKHAALKKLEQIRSKSPTDAHAIGKAEAEVEAAAANITKLENTLDKDVALAKLKDLGVPIGWKSTSWPEMIREIKKADPISWILKVALSGLLIGLGAPFWFDVAKRLAQVRRAFGGQGPAEQRMSGKDTATDSDERKKLAGQIVDDSKSDATAAAGLNPPYETIERIQDLLTELGIIRDTSISEPSQQRGVLDTQTLAAIDRFLDAQGITGKDRAATLGDQTSPDFFSRLLGELTDAMADRRK